MVLDASIRRRLSMPVVPMRRGNATEAVIDKSDIAPVVRQTTAGHLSSLQETGSLF
jgi:hypothetical protein